MTAAIGDGANDVPMILAAHVGIGVRGSECVHAVEEKLKQFSVKKRYAKESFVTRSDFARILTEIVVSFQETKQNVVKTQIFSKKNRNRNPNF